jgi:hypothetical protein
MKHYTHQEKYILRQNAVQSGWYSSKFRRNVLLPSPVSKTKAALVIAVIISNPTLYLNISILVFTVVNINIVVLRSVTPCSFDGVFRHLGRIFLRKLQVVATHNNRRFTVSIFSPCEHLRLPLKNNKMQGTLRFAGLHMHVHAMTFYIE